MTDEKHEHILNEKKIKKKEIINWQTDVFNLLIRYIRLFHLRELFKEDFSWNIRFIFQVYHLWLATSKLTYKYINKYNIMSIFEMSSFFSFLLFVLMRIYTYTHTHTHIHTYNPGLSLHRGRLLVCSNQFVKWCKCR